MCENLQKISKYLLKYINFHGKLSSLVPFGKNVCKTFCFREIFAKIPVFAKHLQKNLRFCDKKFENIFALKTLFAKISVFGEIFALNLNSFTKKENFSKK